MTPGLECDLPETLYTGLADQPDRVAALDRDFLEFATRSNRGIGHPRLLRAGRRVDEESLVKVQFGEIYNDQEVILGPWSFTAERIRQS